MWWSPLVALPSGEGGTLVIQNVEALDRIEQTDLLRWLDRQNGQVISTSAQSLFARVERGLFDEALYYRLNVILLCVSPTDASCRGHA